MENKRPTRKEDYTEKIMHLQKLSNQPPGKCIDFIEFVSSYLNGCGYFMGDFNIHNLPTPEDFIKYHDRDFGTWLLDMALQYNMEQGMEYDCKFIRDRLENLKNK